LGGNTHHWWDISGPQAINNPVHYRKGTTLSNVTRYSFEQVNNTSTATLTGSNAILLLLMLPSRPISLQLYP